MKPPSPAWRRYAARFAEERWRLAGALVCLLGRGAALGLLVLMLRRIVDDFGASGDPWSAVGHAMLVLLLSAGAAALSWRARSWITMAVKRVNATIRVAMLGKIQQLPLETIEREGRMTLHTRVVHDTEMLDRMTNAALGGVLPPVIVLAALLAVLVFLAPLFGIASLAVLVLLWLVSRTMTAGMRRRSAAFRATFAAFASGVLATIERVELSRISATEASERRRGARHAEAVRSVGTEMVNNGTAVVEARGVLGNVAALVLLLMGGIANQAGIIALPSLVSVFAILILTRAQIAAIGANAPVIQEGLASVEHVFAVLDRDGEAGGEEKRKIEFKGELSLAGVRFGYGGRELLAGVDMRIEPGQCVLLTGPNGAGKSTIIRLAIGLCRPEAGEVRADGISLAELDLPALRRQFGVVPQQPLLFEGTIAENIAYAFPDASRAALERAEALSGVDEVIRRLPEGRDTLIGDTGGLLSGGERQRIALARALLGEPRLLILDEPFNHLSAGALETILSRLLDLPARPSILLVSHDLDAVRMADIHYRLDAGELRREAGGRPRSLEAVA